MPLKNGHLTPQEQGLAAAYVATGSVRRAGEAVGYAHPLPAAHKALQRPAIAAEVTRLQLERISNELLPLAVDVHKELLTSKTTPAGAKVQAVKLAYDRAFGSQDAAGGKEAHEMTGDELAAAIDKLRMRQADLAKPIIDIEVVPTEGAFG
jgi:hypothetical protein